MEKKNWPEAAKRFEAALKRNPDSADLQNYLGYTHRNLKQFDLAFKTTSARSSSSRAIAARTNTSARPI